MIGFILILGWIDRHDMGQNECQNKTKKIAWNGDNWQLLFAIIMLAPFLGIMQR